MAAIWPGTVQVHTKQRKTKCSERLGGKRNLMGASRKIILSKKSYMVETMQHESPFGFWAVWAQQFDLGI
jgi:hypothetical protein